MNQGAAQRGEFQVKSPPTLKKDWGVEQTRFG